ncbi:DNA topoisomerase (ATP-hydrolyzing) subunit A [Candidatus Aquiluna sp. UB-MaderosW2red]|uniref:DNA gyrase/topoisomerase IV subunit A n=1 Tax=Candidatus Aquiluna sp. UB-MaderosW2red TaxID=1855377 RepID=UPI000875E2C9|nr:DNA topoisomerase (ATP-hydrolyzing) [Candidatus Aquiluna sp. UB-MaderosW2red]SCX11156.1 DNA gyrase subunit A [Candidatus Aquiluna sp. UB-MaderosW2red]
MQTNQERIVDVDVSKEMRESFLEYSYSVIYSRALPDARDGLKPVQRRIVYQMGQMGLRPDKGHVKSARVTGEVMGKLHPHGDGAIYDALVRMSQSFSLRLPLIDGHGNFGSLDDGPAAARYTEARLAPAALLLNESLDENTVNFAQNYDAQLTEPEVLPAAFPNLLVNGASGIAVGMATNMPPHNLREVVAALQLLIKNPLATLDEIMECIPGPDLPTGGVILVTEALREAYETGRGTFRTRAKISVESVGPRRTGLVVTELPYLVGPERVTDKIRDAVNAKKIEGIHNIVDLTDRENGLRLIIELKSGFDPNSVIEALYRFTPLEDSFGINNVALVLGRPQQLPLKALLEVYLAHRFEVTKRRSQNRLDKRLARVHLLEGLQIAVLNIDEVIEVIRSSDTAEAARQRLREIFDLSDLQADFILELRLRRLTRFSLMELEGEADLLRKEIEGLQKLLQSEQLLKNTVARELDQVALTHGDNRRSALIDASGVSLSRKPIVVSEIADSPILVFMDAAGRVFRSEATTPGLVGIETSLRSDIAFVTETGRAIAVHVSDLPTVTPGISGNIPSATEFLGLNKEAVVAILPWRGDQTYAIGTSQGVVKRIQGPLPERPEISLIGLKDGDRLIGAVKSDQGSELAFVSSTANLLIFSADTVRPQGLAASGMAGINLVSGRAIYFGAATSQSVLITASNSSQALGDTDPGSAKVTALSAYPRKGRGAMGVRCQKFLKGEDQLYFAAVVEPSFQAYDLGDNTIDLPAVDERRDGSGAPIAEYLGSAI